MHMLPLLPLIAALPVTLPADALAQVRSIFTMARPPQFVAYLTGGGGQLPSWLLTTPGASRAVLELKVPYARSSIIELLGGPPANGRFCTAQVARDLAVAAFARAQNLQREESSGRAAAALAPPVGLAMSAVIRSEPLRNGPHRCFVAVRTETLLLELSLTLAKGQRSRAREDEVVSRLALLALAEVSGLPVPDDSFWRLSWDAAGAEGGAPLRHERERLGRISTPVASNGSARASGVLQALEDLNSAAERASADRDVL
jgi:hypothetical protein